MTDAEIRHFEQYCPLTLEQVEKLSTQRLLNYFRKVRQGNFMSDYERSNEESNLKVSTEYLDYVEKLKQILDSRPHIPRKPSKNEQNRIEFQKMLKFFNYEKIP